MYFVVPAATFWLALLTVNAESGKCPKDCVQEIGNYGQDVCNCCPKDTNFGYYGPCSLVRCDGHCVNMICEESEECRWDRIKASCRKWCGEEPESCGKNEFLIYNSSGCKFCKKIEKGVVDPCASKGACNEREQCRRNEVQCVKAPCPPVKECRKICPLVKCARGCISYENRDGCMSCKCCKYNL